MATIRLNETQFNKIVKSMVHESIESSRLADFFKEHGGVSKEHNQDELSNVTDDMIGYFEVFPTHKDALKIYYKKKKPSHGLRNKDDMDYFFHIYTAKDGYCALIGFKRNKVETIPSWGGEQFKRPQERRNRNGYTLGKGFNYQDDGDTYYYNSPAQDFGLYTSKNYKGKLDSLKNHSIPSKERADNLRSYMLRHYPQKTRK